MSSPQVQRCLSCPGDVEDLLLAAYTASKCHYQRAEFSQIRKNLSTVLLNSLMWLHDGLDCCQILVDALQDERTVLDRYNRSQAKAHLRQENTCGVSEDLPNFPLRNLCLSERSILLPVGLTAPIYQVPNGTNIIEAVQKARLGSVSDSVASSSTASSSKSAVYSAKGREGKCRDAPSPEHSLPDANITLVEIATFLPHSIKSWDVIDRIVWNGAVSDDLQKMINTYRSMPYGEVDINSVYLMMRGQMRKRTKSEHNYSHWKAWTVGSQQDIEKPDTFDTDSISVAGFRRPVIFASRPDEVAKPIPFRDLAEGVSIWPDGDDALDLTRCVAWCVEHPETEYFYPTDYKEVLAQAGGAMTPTALHTDAAALERFRAKSHGTPQRRQGPSGRVQDNIDESTSDASSRPNKRKRGFKLAPKMRATRSTKATRQRCDSDEDSDSSIDTDDEAYRGPKRMKKTNDEPRRSGRTKKPVSYDTEGSDADGGEDDEDQYGEDEDGMDMDD